MGAHWWRRACPNCGSVNYRVSGDGYRCQHCGEWHARVRDKKTGKLVAQ